MARISRDQMFMEIAHIVASRGTCPRAKVGAVLVNQYNRIISIGYNGAAKGQDHCDDVGCLMENDHCIRSFHAEVNCLHHTIAKGTGTGTMYVTHRPCEDCTREITHRGTIKTVIYDVPYRYNGPDSYTKGGVIFERYQGPKLRTMQFESDL